MVRFDLSSIPSNATIQSASLDLTIYEECNGDFEIYRLSKQWNPTQTTWNKATSTVSWTTAGGDHFAAPESSYTATGAPFFVRGNVMHFDMTETVRAYCANPASNYGWLLRNKRVTAPLGESQGMRFYATNWADMQAARPKLVVTYATGGTAVGPSATAAPRHAPFSLVGREVRLGAGSEAERIDVLALNGALVMSQQVREGQVVSLSHLGAGAYRLRVSARGRSVEHSMCLR